MDNELILEILSYMPMALLILVFLVLPLRGVYNQLKAINEKNVHVAPLMQDAFPIMEDLLKIINRECDKVFDVGYAYKATKHTYSIEHSSLINPSHMITDKDVDYYSLMVSEKIINTMATDYRLRLFSVIDPMELDEFILEETYHILFNKAITINSNAIRGTKK